MATQTGSNVSTVELVYSRHLGTPKNCPDYRGVLISQVRLYTFILQYGTTTDCPYYRSVLISECSQ